MRKFHFTGLLLSATLIASAQVTSSPPDADPLYLSGLQYFNGNLVLPDLSKAKSYFLASARNGNHQAMAMLGEWYAKDKTSSTSGDSAVYWYKKAASSGNSLALLQLGNAYREGLFGLDQDFVQSAGYINRGRLLNDAMCKNVMAYYYYKGLHHKQNYDSAFALYRQLAQQDKLPNAMYFLGLFYRNGYGTKRNLDSARHWLTEAAKLGDLQAKAELAIKTPENPVDPIAPPVKIQNFEKNSSYQRIKHNVTPENMPGSYTGFAVRYDWSGKHIISYAPLKVVFKQGGEGISGLWLEGPDTAKVEAVFNDSNLVFNNTRYNKVDHYTPGYSETWQFNDARFQLLQQKDSMFITGNIQLYSPERKEPGYPMYVHLSRAADKITIRKEENLRLAASPNPFQNRLQVQFTLSEAQRVNISLKTVQGQMIFTETSGMLLPGTYSRALEMPASVLPGTYVLSLTGENISKQALVIKQ